MRGRGIARGLAAQAARHHDNFRSRPPNTSRPPSMHVDDFMKLEQKSDQNREAGDVENQQFRRENVILHVTFSYIHLYCRVTFGHYPFETCCGIDLQKQFVFKFSVLVQLNKF